MGHRKIEKLHWGGGLPSQLKNAKKISILKTSRGIVTNPSLLKTLWKVVKREKDCGVSGGSQALTKWFPLSRSLKLSIISVKKLSLKLQPKNFQEFHRQWSSGRRLLTTFGTLQLSATWCRSGKSKWLLCKNQLHYQSDNFLCSWWSGNMYTVFKTFCSC